MLVLLDSNLLHVSLVYLIIVGWTLHAHTSFELIVNIRIWIFFIYLKIRTGHGINPPLFFKNGYRIVTFVILIVLLRIFGWVYFFRVFFFGEYVIFMQIVKNWFLSSIVGFEYIVRFINGSVFYSLTFKISFLRV
jgi:hypothetical protein